MSDARYNYFDWTKIDIPVAVFSRSMSQQTIVVPLDGTRSVVEVEHNRNRLVRPSLVNNDGLLVYPIYDFSDSNVLRVETQTPVIGTLYIL